MKGVIFGQGSPRMSADDGQLDLLILSGFEHLYPYWRQQLRDWVREVYDFRHYRNTTGWSMATQGFVFAELLFDEGQLSPQELERYARFDVRVQRWENFNQNDGG